jgi:hypothetical protein
MRCCSGLLGFHTTFRKVSPLFSVSQVNLANVNSFSSLYYRFSPFCLVPQHRSYQICMWTVALV